MFSGSMLMDGATWDVCHLPLRDGVVDVFVSDLVRCDSSCRMQTWGLLLLICCLWCVFNYAAYLILRCFFSGHLSPVFLVKVLFVMHMLCPNSLLYLVCGSVVGCLWCFVIAVCHCSGCVDGSCLCTSVWVCELFSLYDKMCFGSAVFGVCDTICLVVYVWFIFVHLLHLWLCIP